MLAPQGNSSGDVAALTALVRTQMEEIRTQRSEIDNLTKLVVAQGKGMEMRAQQARAERERMTRRLDELTGAEQRRGGAAS